MASLRNLPVNPLGYLNFWHALSAFCSVSDRDRTPVERGGQCSPVLPMIGDGDNSNSVVDSIWNPTCSQK